uniref:Uncharacterized protein n=1 Tax=Lepeophtheirus salmonis TaxID=72036 RepID=A0A0K2U8R8_LEPSM
MLSLKVDQYDMQIENIIGKSITIDSLDFSIYNVFIVRDVKALA